MPRDSGGVYSLPPGYLAITGETIQASQHNPALEDLAAAMSGSLPRNGAAPMTGPIKAFAGTVSAPGLTMDGSPGIGFYKTDTGWGFAVAGVKVAEFGPGGLVAGGPPIGSGMDFWGTAAPAGWLFPYGQAISRTTYAALFAALGTAHGTGDGTTTFNLPDKRGRASFGKDDMGGTSAERLGVTLSGTRASTGSGVITGLSSTARLAVGMNAVGTGLGTNAVISSINSATQVTLSVNSASTGTDNIRFSVIDGNTLGSAGGAETHALIESQNALHTHAFTGAALAPHSHAVGYQSVGTTGGGAGPLINAPPGATGDIQTSSVSAGTPSGTNANSGSGAAHNNLPPGIVCNYIIFAGA